MQLKATSRVVGSIAVVDISGRITLGDGSALLRKTVRGLLDEGRSHILLNLGDVDYIDSSGIGELVSGFSTAKHRGGELRLLTLNSRGHRHLEPPNLDTA